MSYTLGEEAIAQAILGTMRFVYEGVGVTTPIVKSEWDGDDNYGGVKDYILSLIRTGQRRAFMDGYVAGAHETFNALSNDNPDITWVNEDALIGAERKFLEWEKERK